VPDKFKNDGQKAPETLLFCYNFCAMIFVTGGTGFVGEVLVRQLVATGKPVRVLLRPSPHSPKIPSGVALDVAVSSLQDQRSLRSAMKGVDVIFHLAGAERQGTRGDLSGVDVEGTRILVEVAAEAGVARIFYLSHLGADRFSAYPVLRAKALAESYLVQSGIAYTIFRSSVIFGPGDQFTEPLVYLLRRIPFIFPLPGDGQSMIQPLWIEDLVTCLMIALDDETMQRQIYTIGGSETFSFRQTVEILQEKLSIQRKLVNVPPPYLRFFLFGLGQFFKQFAMSYYALDYLSADRTCSLDTLPRQFSLMPARFTHQLDYLLKS
jgi:NADH dehydrogenase